MSTIQFEAIGTSWEISSQDVFDSNPIRTTIEDFDQYFSRFIKTSFISSLQSKKGIIPVREDFTTLLLMYLPLFHLTKGLFTPLIGQQLVEAGYNAQYSLQQTDITDIPPLTDVVEVIDPTHIQLKQPALFDVGAMGKGYLIDMVVALMKQQKQKEFVVDAGGDIYVFSESETPKVIGLENPDDSSMVLGTVSIANTAICGSAGNRRKWGSFHHIINPETKKSPTKVHAVWVIHPTTAIADGLSTALFFVEPEVLEKQYSFEYVIVYSNASVRTSSHFSGELFV